MTTTHEYGHRQNKRIMNSDYAKEMCSNVEKIVLGRLQNMSNEEMDDLDKTSSNNMLRDLEQFLCLGLDPEKVKEKIENMKLSLALRCLKSSNMKKKLNGINQIRHIIEITSDTYPKHWHDDDSPRGTRWMKPEFLCKWLLNNGVLEYILGENSHIEVIKRSASIIKFLSYHKQLTEDHLDLLWKSQEDKHEATVLGVYETINEITLDLNKDSLDFLYSRIKNIPIKKYNEQTLNFVKEFTSTACKVAQKETSLKSKDSLKQNKPGEVEEHGVDLLDNSSDEDNKDDNEFFIVNAQKIIKGEVETPKNLSTEYGLPIIYELSQQGTDLGSTALKALIDTLKLKDLDAFKMPYTLKAIKNLCEGVHVHQSLTIIMSILPKCFSNRTSGKRSTLHIAINELNREFDFVNLTLKNIEKYNEVVQAKMVDMVNKGIVPENIAKSSFEGNIEHSTHLEKLLEFIDFFSIHTIGEIEIGKTNIQRLWNIFVNCSSIENDKNLFFKWLNKEKFDRDKNTAKFKANNYQIEKDPENIAEDTGIMRGVEYSHEVIRTVIGNTVGRRVFTSEEREFLFEDVLCKPEIVDKREISYSCFKCFEKYFMFENRERKILFWRKIGGPRGTYKIYEFESIKGIDALWEIVTLCKDQKVKEESLTLLCVMHLHLDENTYDADRKYEIWRKYIER